MSSWENQWKSLNISHKLGAISNHVWLSEGNIPWCTSHRCRPLTASAAQHKKHRNLYFQGHLWSSYWVPYVVFFCWVFIYMFFCSKKCMFYMIWSCFIIRVIISSTCQALCPIFHAFFSASKWPWRIRIGTWAERHRAAEHWTWRPWKNAWFGLVWTSTEKLHIWWENPWLSYRCSTVQPKKQLLVWLGFSKRRFASCKRLHRRKKTS